MGKIELGGSREATHQECIKAHVVEFICTFFFVFVGVGSAMVAGTYISISTPSPSLPFSSNCLLITNYITIPASLCLAV